MYVDHGRFIGPDHEVVARQLRPEFGALAPENVSYFTLVGKSDTRLAIVAGVAQTTYFSNVIALEDAPQLVEVRWSEHAVEMAPTSNSVSRVMKRRILQDYVCHFS